MFTNYELLVLIVALALQPLFGVLWFVIGVRYLMRKASSGTSEWIDGRVDYVGEKAKQATEELAE